MGDRAMWKWRARELRDEARIQSRGVCSLDIFDSPDPPAPDPQIGQAAAASAEVGREALGLAREQWAWNKAKADEVWPQAKAIVDKQVAMQDENLRRSESEWDTYQRLYAPAEERYVQRTMEWDSPARREERATEAAADVSRGYDTARGTMERGLSRSGVRAGGAGFTQANADLARAQAADTAGAMNRARRAVEGEGMAGLERLTAVGRGRPSTSFAADQLALSAGNSGVANTNQTVAGTNAGMSSAQGWYNTGLQGFGQQGNMLNNAYGNQLRGWQAGEESKNAGLGGLGKLAGTAMMFLNTGGVLKRGGAVPSGLMRKAHRTMAKYANGGMVNMHMRPGYAEGGMVDGPGTTTSDSVPAVIDGQQPARLSTGEAVLNAEAVQLVGEDFVNRINQAGLERRGSVGRAPQVVDGLARRV